MPKWFKKFAKLLSKLAIKVDNYRLLIKQHFNWLGDPLILPYRGFGNHEEFYIRGRVLEDQGLAKPEEHDSIWQNLKAMVKRHTYNTIPEVRIKADFKGICQETITTSEGYFEFHFHTPPHLTQEGNWHQVKFELLDQVVKNQPQVEATGQVLISQETSQFGIISDVDDTILVSHSPHILKKLRLMILKNAHTRLPFEGVSAFYRALQKGGNGKYYNPIIYVSSSSWNLYDLLIDFCAVRKIPQGPFLLRKSRLDRYQFITSLHTKHKLRKIEQVLTLYHDLKFILIGDSGQKDPEIYYQAVKDFPNRIEAIYIRNVSNHKRQIEIQKIAYALQKKNIEMFITDDTLEAAKHAAANGYICKESLKEIEAEIKHEEAAPDEIDHFLK
jgi:phosphatidate phosphatase APP1